MKILGLEINRVTNVKTVTKQSEKRVAESSITKKQKFEVYNDLIKLRNARDIANSYGNYNREELHEIYRQIWRDTMLKSQWNNRKFKTLQRQWSIVGANGEENENLTEALSKPFFSEFMNLALDSKMWGFSLIQFGTLKDENFHPFILDGEVKDPIYEVDRDYVKPEYGKIVQTSSSIDGIPFYQDKFWTVFVGKSHDLGMLNDLADLLLIKHNLINNWSEWAEVFGMDIKIGKTGQSGNGRRDFIEALKNLGSNGIGVFSEDDDIEFKGTARNDAYKVYHEYIKHIDSQVSKIIFGQDVVSNNTGQVVGTVGENVAKMYGNADAVFMQTIVNEKLLPFLTRIGFANFSGYSFEWETAEEMTKSERAEIDLKISQMGMMPSKEYLENTYGIELEEVANDIEVAKEIKNLYKDVR